MRRGGVKMREQHFTVEEMYGGRSGGILDTPLDRPISAKSFYTFPGPEAIQLEQQLNLRSATADTIDAARWSKDARAALHCGGVYTSETGDEPGDITGAADRSINNR